MKMFLVASTALVSVASVALAGQPPQAGYGSSGLDANQTFMCDYGGFDISATIYEHSSGYYEKRAAVPVRGKGETVSAIEVADQLACCSKIPLTVAIYSSRKNRPFKALVSASTSELGCGITVNIPAIQLKKGKKYWIVEELEAYKYPVSLASETWFYATTKTHKGLWQYYYASCYPPYSQCHYEKTAWFPITGGTPYVKLMSKAQREDNVAPTERTPPDQSALRPSDLDSADPVQSKSIAAPNHDPP